MDYQRLINKKHKVTKQELSNIKLVSTQNINGKIVFLEAQTIKSYNLLKAEMQKHGIEIGIISGYRSFKEQQLETKELQKTHDKKYVKSVMAPIGASEHHTGLAIDITVKKDGNFLPDNASALYSADDIYKKIHTHLHKFGFILRYPKGKEQITGYSYEPWHLRFVGLKLAKHLYKTGLTMEEYYKQKTG